MALSEREASHRSLADVDERLRNRVPELLRKSHEGNISNGGRRFSLMSNKDKPTSSLSATASENRRSKTGNDELVSVSKDPPTLP